MNPILQSALLSLVRWALAIAAGFLVKAGIWDASDAETYVAAGALALLALGWSLWLKYRDRVKLLTALTMTPGATENDVIAHIASGAPTPTVSTPPNTIPGVPANA